MPSHRLPPGTTTCADPLTVQTGEGPTLHVTCGLATGHPDGHKATLLASEDGPRKVYIDVTWARL